MAADVWIAFGTWIGGLGTVGTLCGVLYQMNNEKLMRITVREREEAQKIRNQAESISTWLQGESDGVLQIALSNQSTDPVYQAVISLIVFNDGKPRDPKAIPVDRFCIRLIPPGNRTATREGASLSGCEHPIASEVAFTDRSGRHWVRHGNGELESIKKPPLEHYGLSERQDWVIPGVVA